MGDRSKYLGSRQGGVYKGGSSVTLVQLVLVTLSLVAPTGVEVTVSEHERVLRHKLLRESVSGVDVGGTRTPERREGWVLRI